MLVDGAADALVLDEVVPPHGAHLLVDLHERLGDPLVPGRAGQRRVELLVEQHEAGVRPGRGGAELDPPRELGAQHVRVVAQPRVLDDAVEASELEGRAQLVEVAQLGQARHDDGVPEVGALDEAVGQQAGQSLAHGGARHAEPSAELGLGEPFAGVDAPVEDLAPQACVHGVAQRGGGPFRRGDDVRAGARVAGPGPGPCSHRRHAPCRRSPPVATHRPASTVPTPPSPRARCARRPRRPRRGSSRARTAGRRSRVPRRARTRRAARRAARTARPRR